MTHFALILALLAIDDPPKAAPAPDVGKTYQVPYKATDTNHALVRVRLNGKGPFNFLVDTGAPLLFVGTEAAKAAGITPNPDGFYTDLDRIDFEGGPFLAKPKGRVEDVFQMIGMNALGLPGHNIDGILGYSILARFRITIDPTADRMEWTRLDFEPADLAIPEGARDRDAPPEVQAMSMLGPIMKFAAVFIGKKPPADLRPRGAFGVVFAEGDGPPRVAAVVKGSPAEAAGVAIGDVIEAVGGKDVADAKAALKAVAEVLPGDTVALALRRGGEAKAIPITAGEGF